MELDQLSTNPSNQMDSPASPDPLQFRISIKITVSTIQDYRNLTRLLINSKIPFHTHPLDEERKIKAVIKGIPLEFQTDEVKNDLVNQGYPICSVHRLHGRDGRPLSLVLAVLNKTESTKEMCKNLSKVCGLSGITVEPPYKKGRTRTVPQKSAPRAAPEPTRAPPVRSPPGRLQLTINLILGEDIKSVMAILRLVKSEGFAELASDFRRGKDWGGRLAVILSHQDILSQLESL
ncbi:hypothetical protein EVAR_62862_1 [Eumeta japonica]|uniref:Pre-C2HC domain-containing protein n=1 Tax=Eumeta variegata TaxID=151549 RepID=A0A4C1ZYA0_EUMVA|nr:hypothetical protein EVAR_62862_1 [Eumeta japonica]